MAINPYFNKKQFVPEQTLIQDLIDEAIQIHGLDTYYLVRDAVDLDKLFGEDELAIFGRTAIPIEMYMKGATLSGGQSEFITKFGLHIEDQATFIVSVRRWGQEQANNASLPSRPREGDIIWWDPQGPGALPNRYLFEVRFVEDKEQYFQLGKLYTYELRCELMNYSHERVQTGNSDIDSIATEQAFTLSLDLVNLVQPNTAVTYIPGETVYQGPVDEPTASGIVTLYTGDANGGSLAVTSITGTFSADGGPVVGANSATSATLSDTPETRISSVAPDDDNVFISDEAESVIVVRGTNPRTQ